MVVKVNLTHECAYGHRRSGNEGAERFPHELGEAERDEGNEERGRRHDEGHGEHDGVGVRPEDAPPAAQEFLTEQTNLRLAS